MIDSLINTLLVVAGLYVYLSLYRQVTVRQNGAAALGDRAAWSARSRSRPSCSSAGLRSISLAASKVEHAIFQTRDLLLTGGVFSRRHFQS